MFKIIQVDNYNREIISDVLIADNIHFRRTAEIIADSLNEKVGGGDSSYCPVFFKAVPADYELYKFEP